MAIVCVCALIDRSVGHFFLLYVQMNTKALYYYSPHIPGQNGKYWHADSESVTCDSDTPQPFHLELREPTRLAIRAADPAHYLAAAKNGNFRLTSGDLAAATHWEY